MVKVMKQDAKRLMSGVPEEYTFKCHDGRILRNMRELGDALQSMSDETYAYHVNAEKNDFSKWVRDIITDEKLAGDLSKSSSRMAAAKRVTDRLNYLQVMLP